jgi:hypothetical protein
MRKSLAYIVLLSMVLHCASRLGLLDKVYQNRNKIAYSVGLIKEVPIATCSSDYDFGKGLTIQTADDDSTIPTHLKIASEINLFVPPAFTNPLRPSAIQIASSVNNYISIPYFSFLTDVFHPPSA